MARPNRFRRYHYKVFLPENVSEMVLEFINQLGDKEIGYTHHAIDEQNKDKRGKIPTATREELLDPSNTLVEFYEILSKAGRPTGKIQKLVVRLHNLDDKFDYTYVVAREGYTVSNWANSKTDEHRLDQTADLYYCPPEKKERRLIRILNNARDYIKKDDL